MNLVWEALHLPLYTIWTDGNFQEQGFAGPGACFVGLFGSRMIPIVAGRAPPVAAARNQYAPDPRNTKQRRDIDLLDGWRDERDLSRIDQMFEGIIKRKRFTANDLHLTCIAPSPLGHWTNAGASR